MEPYFSFLQYLVFFRPEKRRVKIQFLCFDYHSFVEVGMKVMFKIFRIKYFVYL